MTNIVEHKIVRFTWELVRHTYLVDLESEIEIREVEISPSHENRLLDPPYPFTPFFEIEIDQIQKNGKTVFSFRNICPVQIYQKPAWNILNSLTTTGSSRVSKRFQSQDDETETRWLYTDDFFLISLSSGDRHDLSMLLSLILGKLNMIALSIQSGRRIRSEFENQQKYRADMSTMFSEGVDGAFRDVPVYQQHGEMTGSHIDLSAVLRSAEFHDLNAVVASEESAPAIYPGGQIRSVPAPAEETSAESIPAQSFTEDSPDATPPSAEIIPEVTTPGIPREPEILAENFPEDHTPESPVVEASPVIGVVPEDHTPESPVVEASPVIGVVPEDHIPESPVVEASPVTGVVPEDHIPESPVVEASPVTEDLTEGEVYSEIIPEAVDLQADIPEDPPKADPLAVENTPVTFFPASRLCRSCGTAMSGTAKFCNSCGTAVSSTMLPAAPVPEAQSCSSCGAEVSCTAKFCRSCGTAISTGSPPGNVPPSS